MSIRTTRRDFLSATAAAGMLGLGDLSFLTQIKPVRADDAKLDTSIVRFGPDIEPTVRLLEDTPREKLIEEVAARIRGGLGYREVLAALLLAGVRN
ncbi:MAG: twin-arginine translocation signal domain-containing protein, partial [Planctomycetaceae bacterium]